jgi:DNA-binding GntR family transcriptional regulator
MAEQAYVHLRDAVLTGALNPGEQLREQGLSEELGVSRTPLRQAMQRLVGEGLLESRRNVGVFVRKLSVEELRGVLECRRSLEAGAAALAAEKCTPKQAVELRRLARKVDKTTGHAAWADTAGDELVFHRRVLALADNAELERSVAAAQLIFWSLGRRGGMAGLRPQTRPAVSHAAVAEAIGSSAPAEAFQAMWNHIAVMLERLDEEFVE